MRHTYTWVGLSLCSGVALNRGLIIVFKTATSMQFVEVCDHILTGRRRTFLLCTFLHVVSLFIQLYSLHSIIYSF